ncbi:MAG: thermonuclease family protein [Synechococcaceae bacterium WB8_1B_136]|nr:thermonuclease family protein [Synechococcaceae bacterium WB8_1B_136]
MRPAPAWGGARWIGAGLLVAGLGLLSWWSTPASRAQSLPATVLSIGDGDTLRVRQGARTATVRLACIDAPELAQEPYGQQARRYLQQRLPIGAPVTLEIKATDRYGRLVAEVIGEINIGLALVEDGQAFAYRQYLSQCDARAYLDAEFRASRHRFGIWQLPGGITRPWAFRRSGLRP